MFCAEGLDVPDGTLVAADGNGDVTQYFGDHHRGDAEGSDGFSRIVEGAEFNGYIVSKISEEAVLLKHGDTTLEWRL